MQFSLERLFNSVEYSDFKGRLFTLSNVGFKVFPKFSINCIALELLCKIQLKM